MARASLMRTRPETLWNGQGPYLWAAAAVAAVAGLAIGVLSARLPEPENAAAAQPRTSSAAVIPAASHSAPVTTWPSAGNAAALTITAQQTLVVDTALLNVFNTFLLKPGDDRAERLKAYLKSRLPATAWAEAVQLAERYQTYMQAHDDLLAAQHLNRDMQASTVDIERIAIWREQRDRVRQRLLGERVVQAWYQNDDAQLDQVVQEWRQRVADAQGVALQGERYPVPHWSNPAEEEKHRQYMVGVLQGVVTRYAMRRAQ
ncbi:hypothetical protein LMG19083_03749 [Ralstonia psammae]|uniref:Lipase chaperone n=2 Tax=Ralstonia psammae TaxID=3058598 RepID=A0ABN9J865_9RALS|nr:hypothetical protein LMG19083_03749 [Ralstonia sp. LMG 19083]